MSAHERTTGIGEYRVEAEDIVRVVAAMPPLPVEAPVTATGGYRDNARHGGTPRPLPSRRRRLLCWLGWHGPVVQGMQHSFCGTCSAGPYT
jgi:hypothetical protein